MGGCGALLVREFGPLPHKNGTNKNCIVIGQLPPNCPLIGQLPLSHQSTATAADFTVQINMKQSAVTHSRVRTC